MDEVGTVKTGASVGLNLYSSPNNKLPNNKLLVQTDFLHTSIGSGVGILPPAVSWDLTKFLQHFPGIRRRLHWITSPAGRVASLHIGAARYEMT